MANGNTLMFQVAVKDAVDGLAEAKKKLENFRGEAEKILKLKVTVDGISDVVTQLQRLGDSPALRNLRAEIAELNKEFLLLSKGAGGVGDIASRGITQEIEKQRQAIERYEAQIKSLSDRRTRYTTQNPNYKSLTSEIETAQTMLDGARASVQKLEAQLAQVGTAGASAMKPVSTAADEVKIKVEGLGGEFKTWAQEVQNLVGQIKNHFEQSQQQVKTTTETVKQEAKAAKEGADEQEQSERKLFMATERRLKLLAEVENILRRISNVSAASSGLNPAILSNAVRDFGDLRRLISEGAADKGFKNDEIYAVLARLKTQYKDVVSEADKFNKQMERNQETIGREQARLQKQAEAKQLKEAEAYTKQSVKDYAMWAESMRRAGVEADVLWTKIRHLGSIRDAGQGAGVDVNKLRQQIGELVREYQTLRQIQGGSKDFGTAKDYVRDARFKNAVKQAEDEAKAVNKGIQEKERAYNQDIRNLQAVETNQRRYNEILNATVKLQERLSNASTRGAGLNIGTFKADAGLQQLQQYIDKVLNFDTRNMGDKHAVGELAAEWRALKQALTEAAREQEKMNNAQKTANANAAKESAKAQTENAEGMRKAGVAAADLYKKMRELGQLRKSAVTAGVDVKALDAAINRMERYRQILKYINENGGHDASRITGSVGYRTAQNELDTQIRRANQALRERESVSHGASQAVQQLSDSEQRLANAIKSSTDSMRGQSQVLSDLKSMAMQYLSVWGAQSFISSIIQTGGQLEQQRLSMGAILQDAEKANEIFEQIKELAVKSPFGVVQLDQMSKQLAAYGFEANELFEWTKRLADISAATGTQVSRLSLALGHVRSEGALSGYTLRQFAMGNVPLLRMLAENRGVSTKEIRNLVRKKEISDKEVSDILKQLTDEGGMFYNAQEVMSQALNARFKNLHDAFDIMFGEMAESNVGNVLKGVAAAMTEVAKKWKEVGTAILAGSAAFGIARLAMTTYNSALQRGTASTLKSALAAKQKEAATLRLASAYRTLSLAEQSRILTANRLNAADIRLLLNENKLTREELLRAVAMGKLNRQSAILAVQTSNLDKAQKRLLLSQLQSMQHTRRWAMLWATLGNAIKSAGSAMWAFGKMMLPLAAIGTIASLITARSEAKSDARDIADMQADKILSNFKAVAELRQQLIEKRPTSSEERETAVTEMIDALKEAGKYTSDLEAMVEGTESLADKYTILHNELVKVSNEYDRMRENLLAYLEVANDSGGGSFLFVKTADNIMEDAADLTASSLEVTKAEMELTKNASLAQQALLAYYKERGAYTEEMARLEWKELYELMKTEEERRRFFTFMKSQQHKGGGNDLGVSADRASFIADAFRGYGLALTAYWKDWEEIAKNDMGQFADNLGAAFTQVMQQTDPTFSMAKASEEQKQEFDKFLDKAMADWKNTSQTVKDKIKGEVLYTYWKVHLIMQPQVDFWDEGKNAELDFMHSNPFAYSFLTNNRSNNWNGQGPVLTLDQVQKWFGEIKPENVREGAEKLKKRKDDIAKDLEVLRGLTDQTEDVKEQIAKLELENRAIDAYGEDKGIDWSLFDKKKKDTTGGSKKDEVLESWKKRVSLLEKYRQERDALMKLMTEEQAEAKLRQDGNFNALWTYFGDPNDYAKSLDDVAAVLGMGGDRGAFVDELGAKKGAEDLRQFKESVSEAVSELGRMMSVMQENYDTYKKWMELTGDAGMAASIAGVSQNSSYADWLRGEYSRRGGTGNADAFFALSETGARAFGKDSELFKLWEDWQRNSKKVRQENLQLYEEAIKNSKRYEEKVADINRQLEREKAAIRGIGGPDAERLTANAEKNAQEKIANLTWENFKNTEEWGRVFSDLDKMSTSTLRRMLDKLRDILPLVKDSPEAVKALYEAMEKGENTLRKRSPFLSLAGNAVRMSRLRQLRDNARSEGSHVTIDSASSAKYYGLRVGRRYGEGELTDELRSAAQEFIAGLNDCISQLNAFKSAIDLVASTMDALGMDSSGLGGLSNIFGSTLSGATSLSAFGPWGMAAGAALGLIGGVAGEHDAELQREIEATQDEIDALNANTEAIHRFRERTLGYDAGGLRRRMGNMYADTKSQAMIFGLVPVEYESTAKQAMKEYYSRNGEGSGYSQELKNLNEEREKLQQQYEMEHAKKKSSQDELDEYVSKMAELDEQIAYFSEDLANELWGIDFKGWADQFSDALATAWENGEDAAKAFEKTSNDIMKNVLNEMFKLGVLEPALGRLRARLFGGVDSNGNTIRGAFDANDPQGSAKEVATIIGEEMRSLKTQTSAWQEVYDELYNAFGITDTDASSSASSSIKGITEQTADLLASYINSIRADVSVNRAMVQQYFPMYYAALTTGNGSLRNIEEQARAIAASNEAIRRATESVDERLRGLENKTWKVPVA